MPPRGGPNQKAVAAKEKKDANKAIKDAEKQQHEEAAAAKSWAVGSNARGAAKAEAAAVKADEAARKRREKVRNGLSWISFSPTGKKNINKLILTWSLFRGKSALLAEEEAATGSGKVVKSKFGAATKKKDKKSDLSLLEDALVGDAEKKVCRNQ